MICGHIMWFEMTQYFKTCDMYIQAYLHIMCAQALYKTNKMDKIRQNRNYALGDTWPLGYLPTYAAP